VEYLETGLALDGRLPVPKLAVAIDELTPAAFRERAVVRLEPDAHGPYPDGLHHLVVEDDRMYIDGKRQRYDHWLWLKRWRGMIARRD
jgi:hypothetical protein